jgi:Mor family transcriptional regulator
MKSKKAWMKEIAIEDMPNNDLRLVAESCGIEVAVSLMENMSGIAIYVPKLGDKLLKKRYIIRHYNGHNAKELALLLGMAEKFIFDTIAQHKGNPKNPNQTTLLEDLNA